MALGPGHRGDVLLEDARDIVDMMEWSRRVVPRARWVDERRAMAEADAFSAFGI